MARTGPDLLDRLRRLAPAAAPDRDLLAAFAASGAGEPFAALVSRHGPMVLRLCRRLLGDGHLAEDAFQATFLVLARRAATVRRPESLSAWLYGVAGRIARKAARARDRRRALEAAVRPGVALGPPEELTARELLAALDRELLRLPGKYRLPLELCYWQGLCQAEAARRLGWAPSALRGRLERGRQALRARLTRRGLAPAALLLASAEVVPAPLRSAAVRAALGEAAPAVEALAGGTSLVGARAKLLAAAVLLTGAALVAGAGGPSPEKPTAPPGPAAASPTGATDRTGERLPDGAVARLGSLRFRQGGEVRGLVYTPDGKTLVAHGMNAVCLWDAATGQRAARLTPTDGEPGGFGAAAPGPDGRTLLRVIIHRPGMRELVQVADLENGAVRRRFEFRTDRQDTAGGAEKYVFSSDARTLAVVQGYRSVRLVDVEAGRATHRLTVGETHAVAFTPDGRSIVVGDTTHTLHVFDVATGQETRTFGGDGPPVSLLAFTPDGKRLASAAMTIDRDAAGGPSVFIQTSQVRVWDFARGAPERVIDAGPLSVAAVAFTPDGTKLVTGGYGRGAAVRVWDVATGRLLRDVGDPDSVVRSLAVSPDGRSVATAGPLGVLRQWDLATGEERPKIDGNAAAVYWLQFDPDGRSLLCGGDFAAPRRWEVRTGRPLPTPVASVGVIHGMSGTQGTLSASADGRWLAVAENVPVENPGAPLPPAEVRVIERASGQVRHRLSLPVGRLALSPDGRYLVAQGILEKATQVWDVAAGRQVFAVEGPGRPSAVQCLGFTPEGRLLTKGTDEVVRTWDPATGKELAAWDLYAAGVLRRFGPDHAEHAWGAALAPDGRTAAFTLGQSNGPISGSATHGDVLLLDLAAKRTVRRVAGPGRPTGPFAFSPDGRLLAAGSPYDTVAHLYEVASGREVRRFAGHRGAVVSVAFAPAGDLLVTGSHDATALVWDLRAKPTGPDRTRAELWADLAGDDAAAAYRAIAQLAARPGDAVALMRQHLRTVAPLGAGAVAKLVADLDSDNPAVRQAASRALAGYGRQTEPALRQALDRGQSLEARQRIQRLIDGFAGDLSADELRERRAVMALEWAGAAEARRFLEELAAGDPDAPLTREAAAALNRLSRAALP
jgi:RNA polymerase sigma factor (sigma-70 family)